MLRISVVENIEAFKEMRDEWNALLEKSSQKNFFLRWEWLYNWWLEYREYRSKLYIIVVRENETLIAIAPLYRYQFLSIFREISFLGSNEVCSDYLDFIVQIGREDEIIPDLLSYIMDNNKIWDVVNFNDVPSHSETVNALEWIIQKKRYSYSRKHTYCPYIAFENQDAIENSYSPFIKSTLKRKIKRMNTIEGCHFKEVISCEGLERVFPDFVNLNVIRLKTKGFLSPFLSERFTTFHKRVLKEFCKENIVQFSMLALNNKILGIIYIFVYDGCHLYYQSGFDQKYEMLSPGALLLDHCIKRAFEEGAREFDFLRGDEEYKSNWTKLKKKNMTISIFNNHVIGHILPVLHRSINKFNSIKQYLNLKYLN